MDYFTGFENMKPEAAFPTDFPNTNPTQRINKPGPIRLPPPSPLALPVVATPAALTPAAATIHGISESSQLLNVVLHVVYDLDCSTYSPTWDVLLEAVRCLGKYGYEVERYLSPPPGAGEERRSLSSTSGSLYSLILGHAPNQPLQVYIFAASRNLEPLAVQASRFLLSFTLSDLTNDDCLAMGPTYLRRLFFLHLGRIEKLKSLLLRPPSPHLPSPSSTCAFTESTGPSFRGNQQPVSPTAVTSPPLSLAWAHSASQVIHAASPDLSSASIEEAFRLQISPLDPDRAFQERIWCEDCREVWDQRVREILSAWEGVRKTI